MNGHFSSGLQPPVNPNVANGPELQGQRLSQQLPFDKTGSSPHLNGSMPSLIQQNRFPRVPPQAGVPPVSSFNQSSLQSQIHHNVSGRKPPTTQFQSMGLNDQNQPFSSPGSLIGSAVPHSTEHTFSPTSGAPVRPLIGQALVSSSNQMTGSNIVSGQQLAHNPLAHNPLAHNPFNRGYPTSALNHSVYGTTSHPPTALLPGSVSSPQSAASVYSTGSSDVPLAGSGSTHPVTDVGKHSSLVVAPLQSLPAASHSLPPLAPAHTGMMKDSHTSTRFTAPPQTPLSVRQLVPTSNKQTSEFPTVSQAPLVAQQPTFTPHPPLLLSNSLSPLIPTTYGQTTPDQLNPQQAHPEHNPSSGIASAPQPWPPVPFDSQSSSSSVILQSDPFGKPTQSSQVLQPLMASGRHLLPSPSAGSTTPSTHQDLQQQPPGGNLYAIDGLTQPQPDFSPISPSQSSTQFHSSQKHILHPQQQHESLHPQQQSLYPYQQHQPLHPQQQKSLYPQQQQQSLHQQPLHSQPIHTPPIPESHYGHIPTQQQKAVQHVHLPPGQTLPSRESSGYLPESTPFAHLPGGHLVQQTQASHTAQRQQISGPPPHFPPDQIPPSVKPPGHFSGSAPFSNPSGAYPAYQTQPTKLQQLSGHPTPLPPYQALLSGQSSGHFPGSAPYSQSPETYPTPPGANPTPPGTYPTPPGAYPTSQPTQPASPQHSQQRLDPDQLPSPVQVIEDDKKSRSCVFMTSERGNVPPLVTTKFITKDQGNANPRFLRSTAYSVPCTADLLKSSHIPFALAVTPFAELDVREQPPPLVDLGALGPFRCKRCKAYMSPFMKFIDGGRKFQCPFCTAVTDVPNEYFAYLDHTGKRIDFFSRPELSLGSYEFLVTNDYCKNGVPPKEPAFIFMIDVSYTSVKSGLVQLICQKLKSDILEFLPRDAGADESEVRLGIVTYHKELHFYNVKNSLAQPQMMVVTDVEDVFVPVVDGFLVKLSEAEALIDSLLAQIPELFKESKETQLVLGPVIQAGLDALRSADRVGKLFVFHTGLPTAEAPGKLKNRDDRKLLGTDKEKTLLTPQTSFYSKLGADCVAAGCSVDLFLFPNQYMDLATVSDISRVTSGNIYKYSYFQADVDGERFLADLRTSVTRCHALDATLRIRSSPGIRPVEFYGNFYMTNTTDVEMASIASDSTVCAELKHDDELSEADGAFVQVAVLYTSVSGQRRLRCHNLSFTCCSQLADLFKNCELDVLVNFISKQAVHLCLTSNPKHVTEHILNQVAQILACYRKNCANPSSPGQLVLPECMKLLPLYANCIIKNDSFAGGSEISADDRSYLMFLVNRMSVTSSQVFFYPRLLPVHKMDPEVSEIPVAIRLSAEKLEDSGMYILENGLSIFLWIGKQVSSQLIQKIFGVSSMAKIDTEKSQLLQLDNPESRRLCELIAKLRKERARYLKLTIVLQGDPLQPWFDHFLVEDRGKNSDSSYVDFLLRIHKEIRNILS